MAVSLGLLTTIKPLVQDKVAWYSWSRDQAKRAANVLLYREYAEGEHRSSLTEEMRNMLRIKTAEIGSPFNLNHMDNIIQKVVDRLEMTGIEANTPAATKWFEERLADNALDGLQLDVHEAAIRDSDSYIMVSYDDENDMPVLTQEEAFDGSSGIIMVYGPDKRNPLMALKIWQEAKAGSSRAAQFVTRINAYYPDRVEKYQTGERGGGLIKLEVENDGRWLMRDGKPIGIPIIPYKNRSSKSREGGKSEIGDAISIQDGLNRTFISMIMAAELTAFQIRYAIGIKAPAALSPGMWINAYAKDATGEFTSPNDKQQEWLSSIRFGSLEQGQLIQFIEQAQFSIEQMYMITRTPKPGEGGDTSSGEALKERQNDLVGKVKRCQVNFGNSWEQTAKIMWRVQAAFGTAAPPEYNKVSAKWRSAELRDESKVVDNALKIADRVDEETFLTVVAPVYGWDNSKVTKIISARQGDAGARIAAMAGNLPGFGQQFGGVPVGNGNGNGAQ